MSENQLVEQIPREEIDVLFDSLLDLSKLVFGKTRREYLRWRIDNQPDLTLFVARRDGELIGFKAGYAVTENRYYSWLGGVSTAFRRQGIASELMAAQHHWVRHSDYSVLETHVTQNNAAMVALNLRFGFSITGMFMKGADANYIMQLHQLVIA